jgi:tripartite-type tricarboxylate transporter receptor subunit TctC
MARTLAAVVIVMGMTQMAAAQTPFPSRPLVFMSHFAPGPGPDVYIRPLMAKLGEQLGQTVVLDSKLGAGGAIALQAVARAAPDGYTMTMTTNSNLIQKHVQPDIGYDSLADFAHITRIILGGALLVVPATSSINSVDDLIAQAKASRSKFNYGSGGAGTPSHMAAATLQSVTGIEAVHVPFKNSADVIPALLRGDLQFSFQVSAFAAPQVRAGKLRLLGTTTNARMRQFSDTPTLNEQLKNELLIQETWLGLAVPAKTPAAILRRLHAETVRAMGDPLVQKGVETAGNALAPSESPEEYTAFIRRENDKWREIVRVSGAKPQ